MYPFYGLTYMTRTECPHGPGLLPKAVELSSSRRQGDFESGLNLTKKTDSNSK
jgi:hypothetical protein